MSVIMPPTQSSVHSQAAQTILAGSGAAEPEHTPYPNDLYFGDIEIPNSDLRGSGDSVVVMPPTQSSFLLGATQTVRADDSNQEHEFIPYVRRPMSGPDPIRDHTAHAHFANSVLEKTMRGDDIRDHGLIPTELVVMMQLKTFPPKEWTWMLDDMSLPHPDTMQLPPGIGGSALALGNMGTFFASFHTPDDAAKVFKWMDGRSTYAKSKPGDHMIPPVGPPMRVVYRRMKAEQWAEWKRSRKAEPEQGADLTGPTGGEQKNGRLEAAMPVKTDAGPSTAKPEAARPERAKAGPSTARPDSLTRDKPDADPSAANPDDTRHQTRESEPNTETPEKATPEKVASIASTPTPEVTNLETMDPVPREALAELLARLAEARRANARDEEANAEHTQLAKVHLRRSEEHHRRAMEIVEGLLNDFEMLLAEWGR